MNIIRRMVHSYYSLKMIPSQISTIKNQLNELKWATVFMNTIQNSPWLIHKNFSPTGAAANYSFLYMMYRILNDLCPTAILELGMGQNTKLTSQYVAYNKNVLTKPLLKIVEHEKQWVEFFNKEISQSPNVSIIHADIEEIVYKNFKTSRYANLTQLLGQQKFNLIINDGPLGTDYYSRIGILDILEHNLADDFMILIDDCDRKGELQTAHEVMKQLKIMQRSYDFTIIKGIKHQMVIFSEAYAFVKYF